MKKPYLNLNGKIVDKVGGVIKSLKVLTEDTRVSIGILVVFIGIATWLTTLYEEVKASSEAIVDIKKSQEKYNEVAQSIDRRLSRIEGKLDKH